MSRLLTLLAAIGVAARVSAQGVETAPTGALWWRTDASLVFAGHVYDDYGARLGPSSSLSLGAAVELGLTDQISIELDWLAGYTVWSTLDDEGTAGFADAEPTRDGPHDVWAAARFQIIGESGYALRSDRLRLVAAPGLVIPLPEPDWRTQRERATDGERYILMAPDRHALGAGARLTFGYVFSESFSLAARASYLQFTTRQTETVQSPSTIQDTDYGYQLTLAVEPQASVDLGRTALRAGVELRDVLVPETAVDGVVTVADGYQATAEPWIGVVFAARAHPLLVSVGYLAPLATRNREAASGLRVSVGLAPPQGR